MKLGGTTYDDDSINTSSISDNATINTTNDAHVSITSINPDNTTIANTINTINNNTSISSSNSNTNKTFCDIPSTIFGSIDKYTKKSNFIKSRVSKKKRRFYMEGFDLDLTYITDRIIAMGFPSTGAESLIRNSMNDVINFFNTRHKDHYKVYNLCSERTYNRKIFFRVMNFPFDDHNPPPFQDILFIMKDIHRWLISHPKNVAAIHCKAGKGRTGLIVSIYLLYSNMWKTADEALRYYATVRTVNQKGVTIPSQIRWVKMFEDYLNFLEPINNTTKDNKLKQLPELKLKYIKKMIIHSRNILFDFFIVCCNGSIRSSKTNKNDYAHDITDNVQILKYNDKIIISPYDSYSFPVMQEFLVEFYKTQILGRSSKVFSFWLHTQFVELSNNYIHLKKDEIDKIFKTKNVDISIEIFLEDTPPGQVPQLPLPAIDAETHKAIPYTIFTNEMSATEQYIVEN